MKRLLTATILACFSLLTSAQFTGTVTDEQGVKYTANNDESTCFVDRSNPTEGATVIIPEMYEGRKVVSIAKRAFLSQLLASVSIPSSVTTIDERAFYGCTNLTSIVLPNNLTTIGRRAFSNCSALRNIVISGSITSITQEIFSGCNAIESIVVDPSNTVYDSRDDCNAIIETASNKLILGCNHTVVPVGVTDISSSAFSDFKNTATVSVADGNQVYDSRGNCHGIIRTADNTLVLGFTNTIIPNSVTAIGNSAFSGCSSLTSINIPDGVNSIGNSAFDGCI